MWPSNAFWVSYSDLLTEITGVNPFYFCSQKIGMLPLIYRKLKMSMS